MRIVPAFFTGMDKAMKKATAYIDGTCMGNPGRAGIGVALYDECGKLFYETSQCIGMATNNIAEYQALIHALEKAEKFGCDTLLVYTDSELLARQINGFYKVKDEKLKSLFLKAKQLMRSFKDIRVRHIDRKKNKYADNLASRSVWNQNSDN